MRVEPTNRAKLQDFSDVLISARRTDAVVRVMVEAKDASLAQSCAQRLADVIAGRK